MKDDETRNCHSRCADRSPASRPVASSFSRMGAPARRPPCRRQRPQPFPSSPAPSGAAMCRSISAASEPSLPTTPSSCAARSQGQITKITFTEGQTVQGRRHARRDRSASLSGPARPDDGQPRSRSGPAHQFARPISTATTSCWPRAMRPCSCSIPKRRKFVQLQSAIKSDEALIEAAKVQLEYTQADFADRRGHRHAAGR